jgi:hypothetical protein
MTSSGTPAMRQCPNRPDGPGSASIAYPRSTAWRADAARPIMVAAWRCSRHSAVSGAFQPPFSSTISTTFARRT